MSLFVILGLFPLIGNIRGVVWPTNPYDTVSITNRLNNEKSFMMVSLFATLIWLVYGIFTDLWYYILIMVLVNHVVFIQIIKNSMDNPVAAIIVKWFQNLFLSIMIGSTLLVKLGWINDFLSVPLTQLLMFIKNLF